MNLRLRQTLRRIVQKGSLSKAGRCFMQIWGWADRRLDYVAFNRSLDPETNGEDWLIRQVPVKPRIVDIGFHLGGFSQRVLKHHPGAEILAFDPTGRAWQSWKRLFQKGERVKFFRWAVSDHEGRGRFHDSGDECASLARRSPDAKACKVRIRCLDQIPEIAEEPVSLLKIDAEGFDLNVLEGASRLLRKKWFRIILFEYADGWVANRRFLAEADLFLKKHRYQLFRLYPQFLAPFRYQPAEERFDLGCMFVALPTPIRNRAVPAIRPDPFRQA